MVSINFRKLGLITLLTSLDMASTLMCLFKYGTSAFFDAESNILLKFMFAHIGFYAFAILPLFAISFFYILWVWTHKSDTEYLFWIVVGIWLAVIINNLLKWKGQ